MRRRNRYARRVAVAASIAVAAGFLAQPGPSSAEVTAVSGSAFGYHLDYANQGQTDVGPTPAVALPPGGSATPVSSTAPSGNAGPVFGSGEITVSTQGTPGPTGSVTSSASISSVTGTFAAANVASTCTANETGVTGTTTITGGTVQTDSGDDDPTNTIPNHGPTSQDVPTTLTTDPVVIDGHLHVAGGTDSFQYIFNEQVRTPTSITVNAVHVKLLGPFIVGDLIIGQSVCAITATGATTTTIGTGGTTTTLGTGGTTSTTQATGGTTSTSLNTGVTTTLPAGGVTTSTILNTVPPAPGPLFGSINVSDLIRQIVCPILQQLAADPFLRPFIEPFLVAFGCTA